MPIKKFNKLGFTLIEMMAAIIVLALLSIAMFPVVTESLSKSKNKLYKEQVKNILDAASSWFDSNPDMVPGISEVYSIKIDTLKRAGLLKNEDIKNPINKDEYMDGKILIYYNIEYKRHITVYCDNNYMNKYYSEDNLDEILNICNRLDIKKVEDLSE